VRPGGGRPQQRKQARDTQDRVGILVPAPVHGHEMEGCRMAIPVPANDAYVLFAANIKHARNVVRLGQLLCRSDAGAPDIGELDIGELYRGAWTQAVSALDLWAHQEIDRRVRVVALDPPDSRPTQLNQLRILRWNTWDEQGIPYEGFNPGTEVEFSPKMGPSYAAYEAIDALGGKLYRATLQQPKALAEGFAHVWNGELWPAVAAWINEHAPIGTELDALSLTQRLHGVIERRNRIVHRSDLRYANSNDKSPIDAPATLAAIALVELVVVAITEVLGELPVRDRLSGSAKHGRPHLFDAVRVIGQANAIAQGTEVRYVPIDQARAGWRQTEEDLRLGRWIGANPDRARATWVADGSWTPLRWDVDGKRYSSSGLIQQMLTQAGVDPRSDSRGPSAWFVDGQGSLRAIAERLQYGEDPAPGAGIAIDRLEYLD
jgi:hypothetical protein